MVIAAVCQPLATRPHGAFGDLVIEMEGLRVELGGKRFDLRLVQCMRAAAEPLPDLEIIEIEANVPTESV
jgi:hypothetical protein